MIQHEHRDHGCTSQAFRVHCAAPALFILLLLLYGCAGPQRSTESPSTVPLLTSRDGLIRYPLPPGWFDATSHAKESRPVVWIVRNDYGASISINTITIDDRTRRQYKQDGLFRTGQLSLQLNTSTRSAVVLQLPKLERLNGKEYCVYEIEEPATRDRIRVAVFDTGERVYEVTALNAVEGPSATDPDAFSILDRFLALLHW